MKKTNGWGGKRAGAGRPPLSESERKKTRAFRLTDIEYEKVKEYIKQIRK